jgi:hypothetical protein
MIASALGTEFGRALEPLMDVPGALGAVLADDRGYAVDYIRDDDRISELDVQIVGAQLGHALEQLDGTARARGLGAPVVLLEGRDRALLAGPLSDGFALAFLLRRPANVALAMQRFGVGRDLIGRLLDA